MTRAPPRNPLVAIIGATGTGKSQLAVEIAKRHNGEIINGDAMQLYAGLPIVTNKLSAEEQEGIPHHLLGCIGLEEQTWVVGVFVQRALKVIEEIRARGRLPILVGGTHYYTQSLLFGDGLAEQNGPENTDVGEFVGDMSKEYPTLQQSTDVLLEELRRVDPVMADRWHPNDRRKIQRSLEIYLKTGKKASDVYAEQRERKAALNRSSGLSDAPAMRFPTLLFWLHTDPDALQKRLNNRVDKMLDAGLLNEVQKLNAFADIQAAAGKPADEDRGIWVSIGYKEFKAYAGALASGDISQEQIDRSKADAVEKTKIANRQYAKRQTRWIRIKLINALAQANASHSLYVLDASDVSAFSDSAVKPAQELTGMFLQSCPMPDPLSASPIAAATLTPNRDYDLSATPSKWIREHCDVCGVTCVTEEQWNMHVKSKAHRKRASKQKAAGDTRDER